MSLFPLLRPPSLCGRPSPAGRRSGCACSCAHTLPSTTTTPPLLPIAESRPTAAAAPAAVSPAARPAAPFSITVAAAAATAATAGTLALGMLAGPAAAADALASSSAASAAAAAAADATTATATSGYVPSPLQVPEWQIWVGSIVGVVPFVIGAYEFGKRILIQQRCRVCGGSGLVERGPTRLQRKCPECGGFFPWRGWGEFLSATARPGNGGPLLAPRGQTSVFYKVPPPLPPSGASASTAPGGAARPSPPGPPSADLKEAVDAAIAARPAPPTQQQEENSA